MISRYEWVNLLQNFMPGNAFVFKISRKLLHPKWTRKVSAVSRNWPLAIRSWVWAYPWEGQLSEYVLRAKIISVDVWKGK